MLSAKDVANYFLTLVDEDAGDLMTNMKIQKLAYYAQGVHLALYGKPIFPETIEAWTHGPVVPVLYHEYKEYGSGAIPAPEEIDIDKYSDEEKDTLNEVYNVYGQFSGWALRNMAHEEPPWKNTPQGGIISPEILKAYFKTQLVENAV
jgi:uncharacterized phage-associated protein